MGIENRIAKLEERLRDKLQPPKRGIPDWLQSDLEVHGWIFDDYGDLISAPDPLRDTPIEGPPAGAETWSTGPVETGHDGGVRETEPKISRSGV
jgi:hypothetical protein